MSSPTHQPYKDGKGGVDIGLKPINENEWLEIDNLFEEEITQKKDLFVNKKDEVLVTSIESYQNQQNVLEMILSHLSHFYPDFYDISSDRIRVTRNDDLYYFKEFNNPLELASLIIQEDLVLMNPINDVFKLEAASLCAPTRWSLKEKFGQSLSDIHAEVPGYKEKIDSRVNKIFLNLPDKKIFERFNWSIFDSPELFQPINSKRLVEIENIEPSELFLRVERQSIRRVDKSMAVLFTVRVHVDPITSILKDKEMILDLIKAISNLEDDMKAYKVIKPFETNLLSWLKSKADHG